jgi:hypothetical protein
MSYYEVSLYLFFSVANPVKKKIDGYQFKMSEIENETSMEARQEIERLRSENSELRDDWLELTDELLSYTGLPGQMHRIDVKIKELRSLLVRAADALENSPGGEHLQLVQELRKAAE